MSTPTVAVVGQIPPPVHGQAMMIQSLLKAQGGPVRFEHVPMAFSSEVGDVGTFRLGKLAELVRVIVGIWRVRARGVRALYYPPAGPNLVPILRDIVILLATRWLFSTVVYHFHAGGLGEKLESLPLPLRWAARLAYGRPDLSVRASHLAPEDGTALGTRRDVVVRYGIEGPPPASAPRATGGTIRVLYVGSVRRTKGVDVLLDAVSAARTRGCDIEVEVVGAFARDEDRDRLTARAAQPDLGGAVLFSGVLVGDDKWAAFARADVFAFPTFYECETFGLVLVEAMASGLPVVATRWRGVPTVVSPECARLVEPEDATALADELEALATDPGLRARLGAEGRERFESLFSAGVYRSRMQAEIARTISGAAEKRTGTAPLRARAPVTGGPYVVGS